jgi:poly(hydroxyalkanoate) depolymerase family esterase
MRRPGAITTIAAIIAVLVVAAPETPAAADGPAPVVAAPGTSSRQIQPAGPGVGPRSYIVHQPPAASPAPSTGRPLVVVLHGCTGTAADAEAGSRMSAVADAKGWVVVYPEQATSSTQGGDGDRNRCWGWAKPDHQHRDRGEPWSIVSMVDAVAAGSPVDRRRVHVIGISAGAAMAIVLGAAYPDTFASVAALAGCGYLSCSDQSGKPVVDEMGPRARTVPLLIVQGTEDKTVPPSVGQTLRRQWINAMDLIDDGLANGSFHATPDSFDRYTPPSDGGASGGRCAATGLFPCLGGSGGMGGAYPYSIEHHADAALADSVDWMLVDGLGHAWSGGDPKGTYTDQRGPRVTEGAIEFFAAHPMTAATAPRTPGATATGPARSVATTTAVTRPAGSTPKATAAPVTTAPPAAASAAASASAAQAAALALTGEASAPSRARARDGLDILIDPDARPPIGPIGIVAAALNVAVWIVSRRFRKAQRLDRATGGRS